MGVGVVAVGGDDGKGGLVVVVAVEGTMEGIDDIQTAEG